MAAVAAVALEVEPEAVLLVEDQVAALLVEDQVEQVEQAVQQLEMVVADPVPEPVVMADKVEQDQVGMLVHKVDWVVEATVDTATAGTDTTDTTDTTDSTDTGTTDTTDTTDSTDTGTTDTTATTIGISC